MTFLILGISCDVKDDDDNFSETSLELNFKSNFGDAPLLMYASEYDYEDGMKIKLQLFQFFISSIRLVDEAGNESRELLDVALVSFGDIQSAPDAASGVSISLDNVPTGKYSAIKFGVGVNESLNGTMPSEYQAGHPLSGHYWSAAGSYVFTKIEGNADLQGDGDFEEKLTFHVGGNPRYREIEHNKSFELTGGETGLLEFAVDLQEVLVDDNDVFVDFKEVTQIHNGTAETAVFIMDNLAKAISIK